MCFSGSMGSCLGQHGLQVEPGACFSHAGLQRLWLPGDVSALCVVSSSGGSYWRHLTVIALTTLYLAVLPALPPVLSLSITSLLLSCLALPRLLGAVLLCPSQGGGGSGCHRQKEVQLAPHLLPTLPCREALFPCSPIPATLWSHLRARAAHKPCRKPTWQIKVIIFLPCSVMEGVRRSGSGEEGDNGCELA